jgi:hypothetical protein
MPIRTFARRWLRLHSFTADAGEGRRQIRERRRHVPELRREN